MKISDGSLHCASTRLWRSRLATSAIFFANGLGIGAWAAAIPGLKQNLSLSDAALSLALLAFAAGAVVSMPLAGRLAARSGPHKITIISALAFSLSLALPPFASGLIVLACMAFVLGFCNGLLDVSMNALASGVEKKWGSAIMSSFHAAFSLGGLVGAGCGALFGLQAFGMLMWASAGVSIVLALIAMPHLDTGERYAKVASEKWKLPAPAALALCAIAALCMLVEGAMADWSGVYIATIDNPNIAAIGFAAFSFTMTLGRITGDRIVNALGHARVIQWGGALAMVGSACVAAAPSAAWAVPGFALVGLGLANIVPSVFSAAAKVGSNAAAGVAMVATTGYSGFLVGPPLVGFISSLSSLRIAFVVLAVASGCILLVALVTMGKRSAQK
jgi:MFS family permease